MAPAGAESTQRIPLLIDAKEVAELLGRSERSICAQDRRATAKAHYARRFETLASLRDSPLGRGRMPESS